MNKILLLAGLLAMAASLTSRAEEATKDAKDAKKPKPYTLEKCLVSDEKLGEMGEPFKLVYKGQEFKLCCKSCKKDFDKEPDKYVKKLVEAEKAAKAKAAKKTS